MSVRMFPFGRVRHAQPRDHSVPRISPRPSALREHGLIRSRATGAIPSDEDRTRDPILPIDAEARRETGPGPTDKNGGRSKGLGRIATRPLMPAFRAAINGARAPSFISEGTRGQGTRIISRKMVSRRRRRLARAELAPPRCRAAIAEILQTPFRRRSGDLQPVGIHQ